MIRFGVLIGHDIVATSASSTLKVDFSLLMGSSSLGFSWFVHHTRKGACNDGGSLSLHFRCIMLMIS